LNAIEGIIKNPVMQTNNELQFHQFKDTFTMRLSGILQLHSSIDLDLLSKFKKQAPAKNDMEFHQLHFIGRKHVSFSEVAVPKDYVEKLEFLRSTHTELANKYFPTPAKMIKHSHNESGRGPYGKSATFSQRSVDSKYKLSGLLAFESSLIALDFIRYLGRH
jgi:hypothetical protein